MLFRSFYEPAYLWLLNIAHILNLKLRLLQTNPVHFALNKYFQWRFRVLNPLPIVDIKFLPEQNLTQNLLTKQPWTLELSLDYDYFSYETTKWNAVFQVCQ